MPQNCSLCDANGATLRCSRCKQAYYCNVQCQSAHWRAVHKVECKRLAKKLEEPQWTPSAVEMKAVYNGNGFIQAQLVDFNGVITKFELQYKRIFVSQTAEENNDMEYKTIQIQTSKVDRKTSTFLLRIPQSINDYELSLRFRAQMFENEQTKDTLKWSPYTELALFIPFDAPMHPFQINEHVQYLLHEDGLWNTGKIRNILPGGIAQVVPLTDDEDVDEDETSQQQQQQQGTNRKLYEFPLAKLKFTRRYQWNTVELLHWNEIYNNLLLSNRSSECKQMFAAMSVICDEILHREKLYEGAFVNIDEDFATLARWLSFEIVGFLYQSDEQNEKGVKSVNCGLCPEKDCHRAMMKCVDMWSSQVALRRALQRSHIDVSQWCSILQMNINTMCDICICEFKHFEYMYLCETAEYNQHALCLPCMNRNVLENRRLLLVLNELYEYHGLGQDCLAEIVYFVVGWIHA